MDGGKREKRKGWRYSSSSVCVCVDLRMVGQFVKWLNVCVFVFFCGAVIIVITIDEGSVDWVRLGQVRSGQVRLGQVRLGQVLLHRHTLSSSPYIRRKQIIKKTENMIPQEEMKTYPFAFAF